jgi:hypothetical protein
MSSKTVKAHDNPLVFLPLLDSADSETVLTAMYLFQHAGFGRYEPADAQAISEALHVKGLTHADARVRYQAMLLIEVNGWTEIADVDLGYSDTSAAVRQQTTTNSSLLVRKMLHDERKPELIGILIKHLNDEDFLVRSMAGIQLRHLLSSNPDSIELPPNTPDWIDWVRADWASREATKRAWEQWWGQEGKRYG